MSAAIDPQVTPSAVHFTPHSLVFSGAFHGSMQLFVVAISLLGAEPARSEHIDVEQITTSGQ
jgi:hypothetical protein